MQRFSPDYYEGRQPISPHHEPSTGRVTHRWMTDMSEQPRSSDPSPEGALRSPDGRLRVTLRLCAGGIYIERSHEFDTAGRIVQGLMFMNESEFLAWCDADDARYKYPLMCSNVRRVGCELFERLPYAAT
jgi:hypothetical protein